MTSRLRFRASSYPRDLRQAMHAHDHVQISLVLSGTLREAVHGHDVTAGALSVVVRDAGVRHTDVFGPERVTIAQLSLRAGTLQQLLEPGATVTPWSWSHETTIARPFLRLVKRASNGTRTFESDDTDVVDLLARISMQQTASPRGTPPRWLVDAADALRASWQRGVRVRDVALAAGVHPVYLARCFRRWYGHGVSDALRFCRRRAAMSAIVNERVTLSAIAHATGYADESHLNRDVRAWSGTSPGQLRRVMARLSFDERSAEQVAPIQV